MVGVPGHGGVPGAPGPVAPHTKGGGLAKLLIQACATAQLGSAADLACSIEDADALVAQLSRSSQLGAAGVPGAVDTAEGWLGGEACAALLALAERHYAIAWAWAAAADGLSTAPTAAATTALLAAAGLSGGGRGGRFRRSTSSATSAASPPMSPGATTAGRLSSVDPPPPPRARSPYDRLDDGARASSALLDAGVVLASDTFLDTAEVSVEPP